MSKRYAIITPAHNEGRFLTQVIPAVATQEGMVAPPLGDIPIPIASVLLRRIAAVEATVEAALTGNRKLMAEAMILDGGVSDYATAEKLTDALLKAQAEHLPQFA